MTKHKPATPDIATLLKPLREAGWHWDADSGKLVPSPSSITDDTPWITQNLDFDCFLWNRIFHHGVAQERMVHTHCQNCFKIVVMPRTHRELLRLEEYQETCGMRCKCGIEIREYVSRPYGGYFYSWEDGELEEHLYRIDGEDAGRFRVVNDIAAIDKGRAKYEIVKAAMAEHVQIEDGEIPVILKRGCTEFEAHCGPTDEPRYRHISDEQLALEAGIDEHVAYDEGHFIAKQPDVVKDAIRMRWAEFAHYIGDMSYIEWLGHPISVPPVTYHEEE